MVRELIEEAKSILQKSKRKNFTAIAAMGWAHIDKSRALEEIEHLINSQLDNGMIPHQHESTISRPPTWAFACEYLIKKDCDLERINKLLPAIEKSHLFFWKQRDPLDMNRIAIAHPLESGMDKAPCWDSPLSRVSTHVKNKPSLLAENAEEQLKSLRIIDSLAKNDFIPSEFIVYDPMMSTILQLNEVALAGLSEKLGYDSNAFERSTRLSNSLLASYHMQSGRFPYLDGLINMDYFVPTLGSLAPALMSTASIAIKEKARQLLKENHFPLHGLTTVATNSEYYTPQSSWRGACWIYTNWLFNSLLPNDEMKLQTTKLIQKNGFREFFNPETGEGVGADQSVETAALFLVLND